MDVKHPADTEPDDVWSQAYGANPTAFELKNGGLMVSFTLSETVDTILPVHQKQCMRLKKKQSLCGRWSFFA